MVSDTSNAVLRRKASAAHEAWQGRAMSPVKALKLALARAADDVLGLALAVSSVEADEPGAEDMVADLREGSLLMLLDGPGGALGVLSLEVPLVAGLVEMLTMGRVLKLPTDERRVTRTDAAMIGPLIDDAMEKLAALLSDRPEEAMLAGFRFGVMLENPRMVELALDAQDFRRFRMQVDIAGLRQGEATLALPLRDPAELASAEGEADEGGGQATPTLKPRIVKARAQLNAVLHVVRMPLSRIAALQPGDLLDVPRNALADTELRGLDGKRLTEVRLGQLNGFRAVRLAPGQGAVAAGGGDAGIGAAPADITGPEPAATAMPETEARHDRTSGDSGSDQDGFPELGDLPELGALPELGDLPELGGLPALDDPAMTGTVPAPGDETNGEADTPDYGAMPMAGLPPLGE